jgi:hypothetical protein
VRRGSLLSRLETRDWLYSWQITLYKEYLFSFSALHKIRVSGIIWGDIVQRLPSVRGTAHLPKENNGKYDWLTAK